MDRVCFRRTRLPNTNTGTSANHAKGVDRGGLGDLFIAMPHRTRGNLCPNRTVPGRLLSPSRAVLRKRSGGTRTDHGDRFIERLLTIRETCRLQGRSMHDYVLAAITQALYGRPAPSLTSAGP